MITNQRCLVEKVPAKVIIGIPKELKNNEFRVSATPSGVHAYVAAGHKVLVEKDAGLGSAISNEEYLSLIHI